MQVRTERRQLADLEPFRRIPILAVADRLGIRVRGNKALCFSGHDKKTPSLSFRSATNTWKCFGACGLYGDTISLAMHALETDFQGAISWLSSTFGIHISMVPSAAARRALKAPKRLTPPSHRLEPQEIIRPDTEIFDWLLSRCSSVVSPLGTDYLKSHGISSRVATKHNLRELRDPPAALQHLVAHWGVERVIRSGITLGGSRSANRLVWSGYTLLFPFNEKGKITYIQGRCFGDGPKFMGPRGLAKPIYNLLRLSKLTTSSIIHICEGIPDALSMESHKLAAIAILGASSFREEWVELFMPFDIVIVPDGDAAGETFKRTMTMMFRKRGKTVRHMQIPDGKDASDILAAMSSAK